MAKIHNEMLYYLKNMKVVESKQDIVEKTVEQLPIGPVGWGSTETPQVIEKPKPVVIRPKTKNIEESIPEKTIETPVPLSADSPILDKPYKLTEDYIIQRLLEYEKEQIENRASYQKSTINAYDLVGCIRKTYYALKGIKEIPNTANPYPYGELVHEMGNAVHEVLQKRLPGDSNELKIKTNNEFDYVVNLRSDMLWNKFVVVEFKTKDVLPKQAEAEHIVQAFIYAYLLNTYMEHHIELVQIVYVARGKVGIKVFDVPITEEYMQKVGEKIQTYTSALAAYVEKNVAPPMDHKYVITKNCYFCNYKHECDRYQQFQNIHTS